MRRLRLACPSQIQRVLPEITIPDCMEGVTASIVDSSCQSIVPPDHFRLKCVRSDPHLRLLCSQHVWQTAHTST